MDTAFTGPLSLVPSYIYWHYAKASRHIWKIAGDFGWFLWWFFAMDFMTKTLFTAWWQDGRPMSFWVSAVAFIVGLIIRIVFIVVGLLAQATLWLIVGLFYIAWLVLPVIIAYLLFASIVFILRPM